MKFDGWPTMSGGWNSLALACLVAWIFSSSAACGQEVAWMGDLATAKTEAARRGKPILLHFGAAWCRPCQEVETFVFRNPAVIRKLNESVVPVRIDYDQNPQLAAEFGVKSLPMDVVITTSEKVVQKRNSPTEVSAYLAMLGEIERAQAALNAGGQAVLNEKNQLAETLERKQQLPADTQPLARFDQQRPLAPGLGLPGSAGPTAVQPGRPSAAGHTAPAMPTTVTPPLTAEARPSTSTTVQKGGNPSPAPETIANPFAIGPRASPMSAAAPPPLEPQSLGATLPAGPLAPAAASNGSVIFTSGLTADPPLGLEGDCPVTLLQANKWVKGNEQFGAIHRGRLYLFASPEAQAEFLRDPESYSPLLAGFDPVLFQEQGRLVDGKKTHGVFMTREGRQQVVLFESEETRAKFRTHPLVYLEAIRAAVQQADGNR